MNSNWTNMMWDAESAVGHWAIIYYVSWNIIGRQVLLNLFLAILIDNFTVSQCSHGLSPRSANASAKLQHRALTAVLCAALALESTMLSLKLCSVVGTASLAAMLAHLAHQLWGLHEGLAKPMLLAPTAFAA